MRLNKWYFYGKYIRMDLVADNRAVLELPNDLATAIAGIALKDEIKYPQEYEFDGARRPLSAMESLLDHYPNWYLWRDSWFPEWTRYSVEPLEFDQQYYVYFRNDDGIWLGGIGRTFWQPSFAGLHQTVGLLNLTERNVLLNEVKTMKTLDPKTDFMNRYW